MSSAVVCKKTIEAAKGINGLSFVSQKAEILFEPKKESIEAFCEFPFVSFYF